ncbi:hypothetical protein FHJ31_12675 [Pseudomonas sp. Fig-3]|nr:hypothetical protein FHJ31_12675 [Pseudomonas sp. Fig-3]
MACLGKNIKAKMKQGANGNRRWWAGSSERGICVAPVRPRHLQSRAGSLPQGTKLSGLDAVHCGSEPARDKAITVATQPQTVSNRSRSLPISSRNCAAASNSRSRASWYIFSSN